MRATLAIGLSAVRFTFAAGLEVLCNLPALVAARRRVSADSPPVVLLYSEFGDEINGIAISTRELIPALRNRGRDALYLTPAHSLRDRMDWETPDVGILPLATAVDTPGFPGAEMAFPRLRVLLEILRERRVTQVDILTPSLGCMLMAPVFRALGLTVSSQYRTDIFAYARHAGIPAPVIGLTHFSLGRFLYGSKRIGVPSRAYLEILSRRFPRLAPRMAVLRRGLPEGFARACRRVEVRREPFVERNPEGPRRFFYLGRLSGEKNLALLAAIWTGDPRIGSFPLAFLGEGPYRKELAVLCRGLPAVGFTGMVPAADLAERICEMDFLVFPSGTDTLGQAVLESLCMGIPALVSDQGGPSELVEHGKNGFVLPFGDADAWSACLRRCAQMGREEYARMSRQAREKALALDPSTAADAHWDHWMAASRPST